MTAIIPRMRLAVAGPVLCAALFAGCGGGDDGPSAATAPLPQTQSTERRPSPPTGPDPLAAPPSVPREGTEAADPADVRVLERWLKAIREGRDASAARLFALPSKVQNGTPVLRLETEQDRFVFSHTLPCGAKIADVRGARGYLVVEYELTDRVGGNCGSGAGGSARGAVKVEDGKISEWYRLPEAGGSGTPSVEGLQT